MTAATARAGVARRSVRRVRRVSIDRFLLSTLLAPSLCSRRPAPLDATRHPHVLPSLSLPPPPPSPAPPSSAIFLASFSLSVTVLSFPPAPASPFFPFPRRPTSATRRRLKPENNEPSSRLFLSPVSIAVPSSPSFFLERSAPRISAHFHSFHSQLVFSEASISFVRLDRRAGERRGEGGGPISVGITGITREDARDASLFTAARSRTGGVGSGAGVGGTVCFRWAT